MNFFQLSPWEKKLTQAKRRKCLLTVFLTEESPCLYSLTMTEALEMSVKIDCKLGSAGFAQPD